MTRTTLATIFQGTDTTPLNVQSWMSAHRLSSIFPVRHRTDVPWNQTLYPYLFTGAGVTMATGEKPLYGINVPLGFGFKYTFNNRMNIGAEASMQNCSGMT